MTALGNEYSELASRLKAASDATLQTRDRIQHIFALAADIDSSVPSTRSRAQLAFIEAANAFFSDVDRLENANRQTIDVMTYARDFADRQESLSWETQPADATFTALGLTVRLERNWLRMTPELLQTAQPGQLSAFRELEKQFISLRFLDSVDKPNGLAAALISQAPSRRNDLPSLTETAARSEAETALRTDAAGRNYALAKVRSSAWRSGEGWIALAIGDAAQPGSGRIEWFIRYSAAPTVLMSCYVFNPTVPADACQRQFNGVSVVRWQRWRQVSENRRDGRPSGSLLRRSPWRCRKDHQCR